MKYKALNKFEHNGKIFESGDVVEMDEKEAKPLVGNGNLGTVRSKKDKESEKSDESEEKDLETLSIKELKALAEEKEVDIEGLKKKTDIIEAIEEAEEEE